MNEPVFGNGRYASSALAERLWWTLNCGGNDRDRAIADAAREIDALTEQRVAAALQEDRPAPEGAAPKGETSGHEDWDAKYAAAVQAERERRGPPEDLARARGEIGTLTRHVSGDEDGDTVGYEANLGNDRHVWCGELSKAAFSELDPDQQGALGNNTGWFIVLYERDDHHVLGKAVDEWAAERLVSIIGPALSPDASSPNTESSPESLPVCRKAPPGSGSDIPADGTTARPTSPPSVSSDVAPDRGRTGAASNTEAAQERHLTPGEQSVMKRALRKSTAASSRTREEKEAVFQRLHSSPDIMRPEDDWRNFPNRSETVAAPGPTAPRSPVYTAADTAKWIITSFNLSPAISAPLRDELIRQFTEISLHTERVVRAELLVQIREPSEELSEDLAEAFDSAFLPALRECRAWYGSTTVHPAWARWGPQYLRALADKLTEARR